MLEVWDIADAELSELQHSLVADYLRVSSMRMASSWPPMGNSLNAILV